MAGYHAQGVGISLDASIDIGGLVGISLGDQSRGEVDTTDADSGFDMEFVAGLRDNGALTLECRDLPNDEGQLAMRANYIAASGTNFAVIITLPSTAVAGSAVTISFNAWTTRIGRTFPQATNDAANSTFGLRVTGAITQAIV